MSQACIDFRVLYQNYIKSAQNYSKFNYLEYESGMRLVDRLDYMSFLTKNNNQPKQILHLGSKNSYLSLEIRKRFKDAKIYDLELVHARLSHAKDAKDAKDIKDIRDIKCFCLLFIDYAFLKKLGLDARLNYF